MKNKEDYTEWIDDYLEARLKGDELVEFERLMAEDPSFRTEVEAQRTMRKVVEKFGDSELKAKFKKFHSDMGAWEGPDAPKESTDFKKKPMRKIWRNKTSLAIGASVSVLIIAGIWLMIQNRTLEDPSEKYSAYHSFTLDVEPDTSGTMGYVGENLPAETVVVEMIVEDLYPFHYRFRDTLQIFTAMPIENPEIGLQFDPKNAIYSLGISGKQYQLIRGLNRIVPLEETKP